MLSFVASTIEEGPINSVHGTTGVGVPGPITWVLETTGKIIQDDAETCFGLKEAADALEALCGWDASLANFEHPNCLDKVPFKKEILQLDIHQDMIDIVTPSICNLEFLNEWREFFQGYHVIIIQYGDPNVHLEIPDQVDYELYNQNDIQAALGNNEWIISKYDASIGNFGFQVSEKPFIYTIDDDCCPALNEESYFVNPIYHLLRNSLAPSNPHFFNTLYDPYNEDSDFVRGYPYSLQAGVPMAVSHGLWMQTADYDAPTQLLKPEEHVTTMHNIAITIPINVFYPMCSMNVAFLWEIVCSAFMQGLMGEGHSWAHYGDMFARWASKAVADHLGYGVKSGVP
jgi:reversibly glycosylated polypeptide / UDP-arabinopyranose mutase